MKRRHRLFHSSAMQHMHQSAYGGDVLPPGSIVLAKESFTQRYGIEQLKVSFYSKVFGLDSVFLVDASEKQRADLTQKEVREMFTVIKRSSEDDDFQDKIPIAERLWASARGE